MILNYVGIERRDYINVRKVNCLFMRSYNYFFFVIFIEDAVYFKDLICVVESIFFCNWGNVFKRCGYI